MKTTLARDVERIGPEAAYDAACKRLLSHRLILAWILKRCAVEFRDVAVNEIAEKYIEGTPQIGDVGVLPDETNPPRIHGTNSEDSTLSEGTVFYDIRFHALTPGSREPIRLIINVEAQNNFHPGYPLVRRALYYCSRMVSAQYGTEFTQPHYDRLKKVYSIWICYNPPKERRNTIAQYSFAETMLAGAAREPHEHYDLMTAVMVCLGPEPPAQQDDLLRLLDLLFDSKSKSEEKLEILQRDFNVPLEEKLEEEVSDMCDLSRGVYDRGREEGLELARLESLRAVMESFSLSIAQALEALRVPVEEREKYAALLAQ